MKGKRYVGKTFEEFKRNYEGEKEPIHKLQEFGLNVCDRCGTIRRSEDLFWKEDKAFCESCNKFEKKNQKNR